LKAFVKWLVSRGCASCFKIFTAARLAEMIVRLIRLSLQQIPPAKKLGVLFELENRLYRLEAEASKEYGKGLHTKHRHINYHNFFINNLTQGDRVLDIGSGNGLLSYKMATNVPHATVVGVELNESNIIFAREHYRHPGLSFIQGDATDSLPDDSFDVITLSNVLEHIEHRDVFLKEITDKFHPGKLLVRVPVLERDWRVPLKKELGIDYRLDPTHFTEYTQESYLDELRQAGLTAESMEFRWGEIWSVVTPMTEEANE
jgi:ubiquinone/menaquinone biosynthesis C-methylase UbiE